MSGIINKVKETFHHQHGTGTGTGPAAADDERGRNVHTTGRGGAGNFSRSRARAEDESPADIERARERSASRNRLAHHGKGLPTSHGRGGAGSIAYDTPSPEALEQMRAAEKEEKVVGEKYYEKHAHDKTSHSRGGIGNIGAS